MISRQMEDEIRRIVRDEIAQDEQRRIEQERQSGRSAMVPGYPPRPGTIWMGYDPGCEDHVVAVRYAISGCTLLDFNPDRLEALDEGAGA